MKCIICHERPATVPDRGRICRPIKRICSECHIEELQGDLEKILAYNLEDKNEGIHS